MMVALLPRLWSHRTMIWGLVRRDLRIRYAGSALGLVWTVLYPLLLFVVYLIVFSWILQVKFTEHPGRGGFTFYLLAALLPWIAFQDGVLTAAASVVEYGSLVKSIRFPVAVLVVSRVLASLITLLIGLGILLPVLLVAGYGSWMMLLVLPLLVLLQGILTLGLGLLAASLYPFLRDTLPMLQIGFMIWFYLTPIIYPLSYVPERLMPLLLCNPFTPLVTTYRAVLLGETIPSWTGLLFVCAWTVVFGVLGSFVFTRVEGGFADVL